MTPRRKKQTLGQLKRETREKLRAAEIALAIAETHAAETHAQAKRRIVAIARDLLPTAAALARRGRPRLLAVLGKIIENPRLGATLNVAKIIDSAKTKL